MQITVNGESRELTDDATVRDLLVQMGLDRPGIAVAVGMQVVPRTRHGEHALRQGDKVEVIRAVGGG